MTASDVVFFVIIAALLVYLAWALDRAGGPAVTAARRACAMTAAAWLQIAVLVGLLLLGTRLLGPYLARVYARRRGARRPRPSCRSSVLIYRAARIDPEREQPWTVYARSVIAFSLVSVLGLYALAAPAGAAAAEPAAVGVGAAVARLQHRRQLRDQHQLAELRRRVDDERPRPDGGADRAELRLGCRRHGGRRRPDPRPHAAAQSETIGNFWVDLVRGDDARPPAAGARARRRARRPRASCRRSRVPIAATTLEGATQTIYRGPIASQESIKELGTNGGGVVNANSAHPFENPTGLTNFLEIFALLLIPFALTYAFGRLVGDQRQGWAIFAAMFVLWAGSVATATYFEVQGNPRVEVGAVNMEGKEVRFGAATSALFAASTTGTSTGAVISSHDSFTPGGGAVPLVNMLLGEVSPGGVGAGLYGMLVFVLLAVFISGLMVGRTPEYLGKKIQAAEMKLVVLYLLAVPILVLVLSGCVGPAGPAKESILNPGPHGLSEVVYAFASQANNNGSAFAGLTGDTDWYNTTGALAMLAGQVLPHRPGAGHRRIAGAQADGAPECRDPADPQPAVRGHAACRDRDRRRARRTSRCSRSGRSWSSSAL